MSKRLVVAVFAVMAMVLATLPAMGATGGTADRFERLRLDPPVDGQVIDVPSTEGIVEISVRLSKAPTTRGGSRAAIEAEQADFAAALAAAAPSASVTAQVDAVLNAVFVSLDATEVNAVAEIAGVTSIRQVAHYQLALSETVPYIGAATVQASGVDGTGVTVAVLDSGIDYTHANLGGPGTFEAYAEAWGTEGESADTRDGVFPTEKVVDGMDFVGETWPNGARTTDDDPIDFQGHGSHVSDIIAGVDGVAPGADLIGIKVCSAVATSCNGVALILGMDFAVDSGVDIINMSLGSIYGQPFDDDLSQAVDNATAAGVLTVASAGNSADKPYVTGSPAAAPTALSVAQTQVPSAVLPFLTVSADGVDPYDIDAVHQSWSPFPTETISGSVVFDPANADGCAAWPDGTDFSGQIVLMDRGACNFTLKALNAQNAGALVAIIGLIDNSAPFDGGDGGDGPITIPSYMISLSDSTDLKNYTNPVITIDPGNGIDLVGTVVGSSSRGPVLQGNKIKPEIGAPGASVSAIVGTGTGTGAFGGTSGAAPMVSGSAALMLDAYPDRTPAEVKAALINTGFTEILTSPGSAPAPITRIGGGELRVDRAVATSAAAWDVTEADSPQGALSFGFVDATGVSTHTKTINVTNYGTEAVTYTITPTFRYDADAALGAVTPSAPGSITVGAGESATFDLSLEIDGAALSDWFMDSGFLGDNGAAQTEPEIDGYVMLDADGEDNDIHLPWMVLPRKSADVDTAAALGNRTTLTNNGVGTARLEAYDLLATSDDLPPAQPGGQAPVIDFQAVGVSVEEVAAGSCSDVESAVISFAVSTYDRYAHANAPALYEFDIDTNGDGTADYAVFNADLSLLSGTFNLSVGQNVVYAQDLTTGATSVRFYTDHQTNSSNTVLNVCAEQLGYAGLDGLKGKKAGVALAADLYFTGAVTDFVEVDLGAGNEQPPIRIGNEATYGFDLAPGASETVRLFSNSSGEKGALILIRDGAPEGEEAIILEK